MEWASTEQAITHVALTKNPRGLRNFAPLSLVVCTASEVGTLRRHCLPGPALVCRPANWRAELTHVGFCITECGLQQNPSCCIGRQPACSEAHLQAFCCPVRNTLSSTDCPPACLRITQASANLLTTSQPTCAHTFLEHPTCNVSTSTHLCPPLPADLSVPRQPTCRFTI